MLYYNILQLLISGFGDSEISFIAWSLTDLQVFESQITTCR